MISKILKITLITITFIVFLILSAGVIIGNMVWKKLPTLDIITDYKPKIPLRVYTSDGFMIGEFGEERRSFVKINDVPLKMKQAILAAEDDRFYEHGGVDYIGVIRAIYGNVTGAPQSGASTITMQVAKNFFLSPERTMTRKFNEALLSFKIERTLTKDQILELYVNQIFLGKRSYGFSAAAWVYYKKPLNELSLGQIATLAGLPKSPGMNNPVANLKKATERRDYVLRRMLELKYITPIQFELAKKDSNEPVKNINNEIKTGLYLAEMVRSEMYNRYGEASYISGLKVTTTVSSQAQRWAFDSLRSGLIDFDRKNTNTYREPEFYIDLASLDHKNKADILETILENYTDSGNLMLPAIVTQINQNGLTLLLSKEKTIFLENNDIKIAKSRINGNLTPDKQVRVGSLIRVSQRENGSYFVTQMPKVEGAFVAVDPTNGALQAFAGGFDFNRNKFNHVTQAMRQPGSTFKPFIYAASLSKGFTTNTYINDAPLAIKDNGRTWAPQNSDGRFYGPMTLRYALTQSRNLVSIRILQAITPKYAQEYIQYFGFKAENHPAYLPMALGAGSATPWQMAMGYTVFANGGYHVTPYFIEKIQNSQGKVIFQANPKLAGNDAPYAIDPRIAFIMNDVLKDVVLYGTATAAKVLKRSDIGGKTGTTNDFKDSWFAGTSPYSVGVAWVGYDQAQTLGRGGYGGVAALPIFINYMHNALKDLPDNKPKIPEGIVVVKGSGLKEKNEYFLKEYLRPSTKLQIEESEPIPKPNNMKPEVPQDPEGGTLKSIPQELPMDLTPKHNVYDLPTDLTPKPTAERKPTWDNSPKK
ncbi:MAG: PBP1A family penicillin-binding protein [Neisseriaceae bacterium]|nr:PBP1A family penicillin-binding protein [Neisseriaceae bacterium]